MTVTISHSPQGGTITAAAVRVPPRRPLPVVLVRLDVGEDSFWFSDNPWIDTAEGIQSDTKLARGVSIERRVTTPYWGSGRSRFGLGQIELINADGDLDFLLFLIAHAGGADAWLYLGDDATLLESMHLIARAKIERPTTQGESVLRLVCIDGAAELRKAIITSRFTSGPQDGQLLPVLFGKAWSIASVAADPPKLRFGTHHVTGLTTHLVRNRGAQLTKGVAWDDYSSGQIHGHAMLSGIGDNARITCDATSPAFGSYAADSLPGIVGALVEGLMGWDSSRIDYDGLEALATELDNPTLGGWYASPVEASRVLDDIAASIGGWWYVDLLGVLHMDRLRAPAGDPVFHLTEDELVGEVQVSHDAMSGLSDAVLGMRNQHVHAASELGGSVQGSDIGATLQRAFRARVPFEVHPIYQRAESRMAPSAMSASALIEDAARPPAARADLDESGMPTMLADEKSVTDEASRREAIAAVPGWWIEGTAELTSIDAATLMPGTEVAVTVTDLRSGEPRLTLDARLAVVIAVTAEAGDSRAKLVLRAMDELEEEEEDK